MNNMFWKPTAVVKTLHNDTDFVTSAPCSDSHKHRHRTWVVRVVHDKSTHSDFMSGMRKWFHNGKKPIRWLLVSTNKNREKTQYTQTSYVLLWFSEACREATILRNMIIAVGGIDTQLQACKKEAAQIRSEFTAEDSKMILGEKRDLAETVKNEISYAIMSTADFWNLAETQIKENEEPQYSAEKNRRCDLVLGYPRKVKFVKKRKNKSLEATVEQCKQRNLKKIHRPDDVAEQESKIARHRFMMAHLQVNTVIHIQYKNKKREAIIVDNSIEQNMELCYKVQFFYRKDIVERFHTLPCRSENLLDVELRADQYIGASGLVLERK